MNRKLEFALLAGMIALVFLGRWEGKREADKYYAYHPRIDPTRRAIQGFHLRGDCVFGGTDYSYDYVLQEDGPCVIRELTALEKVSESPAVTR